jgi:hypothetical protein
MKNLKPYNFNAVNCRLEWNDFDALLRTKQILSEREDVIPFFKKRHDLSTLICSYIPNIKKPDVFAHEFQINGDFVADLIVGDSKTHNYLLIEFEDGRPDSIFMQKKNKATPDWAKRFESAFSQLVDWLWRLEDMRSTSDFHNTFGSRRAKFQGLIVIGKDMQLSSQEIDRLNWRNDKIIVDSTAISCVSFNKLSEDCDYWLKNYYGV